MCVLSVGSRDTLPVPGDNIVNAVLFLLSLLLTSPSLNPPSAQGRLYRVDGLRAGRQRHSAGERSSARPPGGGDAGAVRDADRARWQPRRDAHWPALWPCRGRRGRRQQCAPLDVALPRAYHFSQCVGPSAGTPAPLASVKRRFAPPSPHLPLPCTLSDSLPPVMLPSGRLTGVFPPRVRLFSQCGGPSAHTPVHWHSHRPPSPNLLLPLSVIRYHLFGATMDAVSQVPVGREGGADA